MKKVRFRTRGCYPLTGAIESEADTLPASSRKCCSPGLRSRQGRVIDQTRWLDGDKKQEGYF